MKELITRCLQTVCFSNLSENTLERHIKIKKQFLTVSEKNEPREKLITVKFNTCYRFIITNLAG